MSTTIDYYKIKEEVAMFLRNSDVYTTTVRGVTTTTKTGTLSNQSTITISVANVKNIRSVTVASVLKTYVADYTVDLDSNSVCLITFTAPQTGAYSVVYDAGPDKIFTDLPRADLSLSSFPRLSVDMIGDSSDDIELSGSTKQSNVSFSIYVYDFNTDNIDNTLKIIREKFLGNQSKFHYFGYTKRIRTGPLLIWATYGNTKIMLKTMDYMSGFNYEFI